MMFFSCSGLSLEGEMTGVSEAGISYLHAAMRRANKRYLLCDSAKVGKTYPHHLGMIEDVDGIFCDVELPETLTSRMGGHR